MKENNNNSKQVLLSVLGVAILVVAVVGVSFAAFTFSQTGEKTNTITTGVITMNYKESDNYIHLTNAMPMNDSTGAALPSTTDGNVFDFTVSGKITGSGNTTINYAISAVPTEGTNTLKNNFVKVYLTDQDDSPVTGFTQNTGKLVSSLEMGAGDSDAAGVPEDQRVLFRGTFTSTNGSPVDETREYRLRMWVADNYEVTGTSETYTLKVNVYGKADAQ